MTPFPLPVTAVTSVLLALLFLALTLNVVRERRSKTIAFGDNDDKRTRKRIRGQANAAEQIPISLILLAIAEAIWGCGWALAVSVPLLIGRYVHGAYFGLRGLPFMLRSFGMGLTVFSQIVAMILIVTGVVQSL